MTEHDPIARLRAVDPARTAVSDPNDPDVRATLEAILVDQPIESPATPNRPARKPFFIAIAAACLLLAGVVGALVVGGDDDAGLDAAAPDPGAADPISPTGDEPMGDDIVVDPGQSSVTSCVESYEPETLKHREHAFDGTVQSIEGRNITFVVNEWFTEPLGETITLDHNDLAGMLFAPEGPKLEPETRVLTAGDGEFIWSCGFTNLYSEELATEWRTTLKG